MRPWRASAPKTAPRPRKPRANGSATTRNDALTATHQQGTQSPQGASPLRRPSLNCDGIRPFSSKLRKPHIMLHSALINVMVKAARHAGRSLKRDLGEIEHLQVSLKGPANFVTMADKRAEELLYADLTKSRPGYGFIGEEGGTREGADKSHTWIVDPLDGTTNFLHGIPQFAISIGLQREGVIIAGVIYNPANEELYIAERGKGAFLNDQRLRVA